MKSKDIEYEIYHVGSKIANPSITNSLMIKIYKYYYEKDPTHTKYILNETIMSSNVFPSPIVNILTKKEKKASIQINLSTHALNVRGDDRSDVFELSKELRDVMISELGFDLKRIFSFYEIITTFNLKVEKDPENVFKTFLSNKFSKIGSIDLNVNHIRLSDNFSPNDLEDRLDLQFQPSPISSKIIVLRLLKRTLMYDDLKKFHEGLEKFIKELREKIVE